MEFGLRHVRLHILSPLDLAVSKIARWNDVDQHDVTSLVRLGLVSADALERRATSALTRFVAGHAMLALHIRQATALARQNEADARSEAVGVGFPKRDNGSLQAAYRT